MENGNANIIYGFHTSKKARGLKSMKYITDSIGKEYEKWKPQQAIFISSPTGSGKTTFILKELLPYVQKNSKKMLYLVNRTILMEQLQKEIDDLPICLSNCISLMLYQTLEQDVAKLKNQNLYAPKYYEYDYIICDEAHYFLADSNYNTNTIISYNYINKVLKNSIKIYMSATIEDVQSVIETDRKNQGLIQSYWYGYPMNMVNRFDLVRGKKNISYEGDRDYGYIDIDILASRDEIKSIVINSKEKWLIFVDNKTFGKTLAKEILRACKNTSKETRVNFITSDYDLDEEAEEIVEEIAAKGNQEPRVLIATSVLDNGVNIKDRNLRNIIIVADTETEFIQMLGRRRNDGQTIKLYIYKHDVNHFQRREKAVERRKKLAQDYIKAISKSIHKKISSAAASLEQIEWDAIGEEHKKILYLLMNNQVSYEDIKSIFFSYHGRLVLNGLSIHNLDMLHQYYLDILAKFKLYGEDAFLKEQLSWLGKSEEDIENLISKAKEDKYEMSREKVIKELEAICDQKKSFDEAVQFKKDLASDLKVLVEYVGKGHENYEKYKNACAKNDRPISSKFMTFLRENCNIPFIIDDYTVTRVEK